jgi:hypothetical protein
LKARQQQDDAERYDPVRHAAMGTSMSHCEWLIVAQGGTVSSFAK